MGNLADLKVHIGSDFSDSGFRDADAKVARFGTTASKVGDTAGASFTSVGSKASALGATVDQTGTRVEGLGSTLSKVGAVGDTAGTSLAGAGSKASGFAASIEHTGTKADGLGSKLGRVGEIAGGFLAANVFAKGAAALTGFLSDSIAASSNLGESLNAVSKIFGSSQQEILDWGKNNAVSFGLSQRAFNELATPLGAGLKNAGLSMDDTANSTIMLTKRAADLASVFNTDVSTVMESFQSAMRGEADSIEKFGVGMSAAKVQAQALADTGKTVVSSLTEQELAHARMKMIMDQTNTSAGDFQATSDGYANSQRIAAARTEELQAKIGDKLVPVMLRLNQVKLALVTVIAERLLPVLAPLIDFAAQHPVLLAVLAGVVGGVMVVAFTAWAVSATAAAFATLGLTWPILAVIAAGAALVAGIVWLVSNWDWLAEKAGQVWDAIYGAVSAAVRSVTGTVSWGVNAVSATLSWFGSLAGMFWGWLNSAGNVISGWINNVVGFFGGLGGRVLHAIGNLSSMLWNSGIALVSGFWDGIVSRWNQMVDWVRQGMGYLRDLWPFSPAKTGPFSGQGYVTYSGAALTSDFAESILRGIPEVASAASALMDSAAIGARPVTGGPALPALASLRPPPGIAASGGGGGIQLTFSGADPGSELGRALVEYLRQSIRIQGGDVQGALGA